jgi:trans-2,3-dihydro-3-hydroxyanthranilate isomerase
MPRTLAYSVLDVFAERPLEGNALAVFHDARGLSDDEMQRLARETNLSETTFIFPSDAETEQREGVRVRIFTTQEELPFAGHPTLGTATWLYLNHPTLRGAETIMLRLNVGKITVRFDARDEGATGVRATMVQNDPVFGATHDREEVARAIGLQAEDLSAEYAPQTVSTGVPFCIVLLRSLAVSQRLQLVQHEAQAWTAKRDAQFFYCIAPLREREEGGADWHARMQFYSGEDPATGSAAGCCIAWLVKTGLVASGRPVVIEQGIEMRRPSRIGVEATMEGERVHSVRVSGCTICVAVGRFFLP